MTATWYVIKYVPDLRRYEPRNVGVVLQTAEGWLSRFVAEKPDGGIDGRTASRRHLKADLYRSWVSYYRRKASDEKWPDVERMQRHRSTNFVANRGGVLLEQGISWRASLDELYSQLVEEPPVVAQAPSVRETALSRLLAKVDTVFDRIGIAPQRDVHVPARFGKHAADTQVPFRYQFVNGQPHLMDLVHLHATRDTAAAEARELSARVDAARKAGSARSFVTFYASSVLDVSSMDDVLYPVEAVSDTVDVDDETLALDKMQQLMLPH